MYSQDERRRPSPNLPQVFRLDGEYWTIVFDGQVVRLRDSKGLRYLAALLARPGTRLHAEAVLAYVNDRAPLPPDDSPSPRSRGRRKGKASRTAERARLTVTKGIKAALERIAAAHPALAAHLVVTVRRGYFCSYSPDPRTPISWAQ